MTIYYVDSNSSGDDTGSSWTNAAPTVASCISTNSPIGNDYIYVHVGASSPHTEDNNSADVTWIGTSQNRHLGPVYIVGVDRNNSDAYTISSTSINITMSGYDLNFDGNLSVYGLWFDIDTEWDTLVSIEERQEFQDCTVDFTGTGGRFYTLTYNDGPTIYRNCTFTNASGHTTAHSFNGIDEFYGCTFSMDSQEIYWCYLYSGITRFVGCDFSGVDVSSSVFASNGGEFEMIGCKLPPSTETLFADQVNIKYRMYESDTVASNSILRNELVWYTATSTVDTSNYRSGGATYDGTNGYSYLVDTNTSTTLGLNSWTDWNSLYVGTTGSTTFTVHVTNGTADLTDREIWLEVEYFGSASHTQKTIATDEDTDPTSSGTTQTDGSSSWQSAGTYPQELSVTVTIGRAGMVRWRVGFNTDTPVYVCPKIEVS